MHQCRWTAKCTTYFTLFYTRPSPIPSNSVRCMLGETFGTRFTLARHASSHSVGCRGNKFQPCGPIAVCQLEGHASRVPAHALCMRQCVTRGVKLIAGHQHGPIMQLVLAVQGYRLRTSGGSTMTQPVLVIVSGWHRSRCTLQTMATVIGLPSVLKTRAGLN